MKTVAKKSGSDKSLYSELKREERRILSLILSPLELAALRHNYNPFSYKIEGRFIYFSGNACRTLAETTRSQISFVRNRMNIESKSTKVPRKLREVFEDPAQVLNLQPYLRNRLCALECYTMLRIMLLGRDYFVKRKEFGPKSIKLIEDLFAKYRSNHLFK